MEIIDIEKWARKVPYKNFMKYSDPIFSLSTRLDVTELYDWCKRKKTSFFSDFLFVVMKSVNAVDELKLRIYKGNVVKFDVINPSYIVLNDYGVIVTCRNKFKNYPEFYAETRRDIEKAKHAPDESEGFNVTDENNLVYISCMPWVDITSIKNPYDMNDPDSSSIPRITWGKFVEENGRKKMTIDIAAHHALIDGEPICRAFLKMQEALDNPEKILK